MSREIKLRIWSKSQNKYMDGPQRFAWAINDGLTMEMYIPQDLDGIFEEYTGLTDKNGKEIYVGDIVEIDKYGKFQIIWNEWACKFDFDKIGKREREEPLLSQDWEQKTEVIGNIHEKDKLVDSDHIKGGKE